MAQINDYLNGAVTFPLVILPTGKQPLDGRLIVKTKAELNTNNFKTESGDEFWYLGMVVSCLEDSKVYILKLVENVPTFCEVTPDLPENAYKNTTYVIEESKENGKITIIPSDGDAYDVPVHGLQDAAYTTVATLESTMDTKDAAILEAAKKYTDEAKAAVIGDATEAGNTLGKLEDRIEAIVTNEKTYSVVKLSAAEVTALGNSNVKEAYRLIDEDKAAVGDPILIYKDSSLKSAAMGTGDNAQKLMLTYILADGSESVVPVDLSAFYAESETGNGLQLINHVISVKRDDASEAFLTVGTNGVKLAGVQNAINTAEAAAKKHTGDSIAGLNATVGSQTVAAGKHIAVEVVETAGKLTGLTIVESDIASAREVEENAQVTAAALNDLNERIDAIDIPTELGVMSVSEGTDGTFVTTTIGGTDANPTVGVAVTYTTSTETATALATDAYVKELMSWGSF